MMVTTTEGVELQFIGEIPADWEIVRVRRITQEHKQGYYTEQPYVEEGVKLVRITDIDDFANISFENMPFVAISAKEEQDFNVQDNDFLFARSGTIGRFGLVKSPERSVFASYLIRFRFKGADSAFLRFVFSSYYFKEGLISTLHGGANKNIHAENIKEQFIAIPSPELQIKIASFLERKTAAINTLIAKKQRLIQLLEEKCTALINQAATKGLNPNAPMKDSGIPWIGEIPEHWEVCPLKYVTTFSGGSTPDKSNLAYWNGSIPWVTPKDMKRFWIGESIDCITELALQETSIKIIQPPVVLVVVRGMILAHSFPVALTTSPLTVNQDMKVLVCSNKTIADFLARQLSACRDGVLSLVQEAGHGTKALRTDLFEKLLIVLPPIKEQKEICSFVNNEAKKFASIITRLNDQTEKLQEYRRSLITAAVTGKLDLKEEEAV